MPSSVHRVVALALPGVVLLDLAAPTHLFGHCGAGRYSFGLAAPEPGPVPTSTGFAVVSPAGLDALREADTIVVPGCEDLTSPDPQILAALAGAHRCGARVLSICTGAFVLGHAGLLDGRRATTHWQSCARSWPAGCWRRRRCRSRPWPSGAGSGRPRPSASTSPPGCGRRRRPTGDRSGPPARSGIIHGPAAFTPA